MVFVKSLGSGRSDDYWVSMSASQCQTEELSREKKKHSSNTFIEGT